jgi:hypothetical protein
LRAQLYPRRARSRWQRLAAAAAHERRDAVMAPRF